MCACLYRNRDTVVHRWLLWQSEYIYRQGRVFFLLSPKWVVGIKEQLFRCSPCLLLHGHLQFFPTGAKLPRHEADISPLSRAEFKNAWSGTYTLPYVFMVPCLLKHKEEFTACGSISILIPETSDLFFLLYVRLAWWRIYRWKGWKRIWKKISVKWNGLR